MQKNQPKTAFEEKCNALSHLSASIFFLLQSINSTEITSLVYLVTFSVMFFCSFLYHSQTKRKNMFRNIDMFCIYIVIGATGILVPQNLSLFQCVLMLSILSLSAVHHAIRSVLSIPEGFVIPVLYMINGLIVACMIFQSNSLGMGMLSLSLITYLAGFLFYVNDHVKYFHTGWHVACSAGAYFMYCHMVSNLP